MPKDELVLELPSTPKILAKLRNRIRKFAESLELPPALVDSIELAVDEAVSNVILHAYEDQAEGKIKIRAWKEHQKLVVAIRDFGKGYDPKPVGIATIRRVMKNYSRGGMGRYLMKMCMDSVKYSSMPSQYNETLMIKRITH